MTITGLYDLQRKLAPEAKTDITLDDLKRGYIGVDAQMQLYNYVGSCGKNAKLLADRLSSPFKILRDKGLIPIFVFDGPMSVPEKVRTGAKRNKRKSKVQETIEQVKVMFDASAKRGLLPLPADADSSPAPVPKPRRVTCFIDPRAKPEAKAAPIQVQVTVAVPVPSPLEVSADAKKKLSIDDELAMGLPIKISPSKLQGDGTSVSPVLPIATLVSQFVPVDELCDSKGKLKFSKGITEKLCRGGFGEAINTLEGQTHKVDQKTTDDVRNVLQDQGWLCIRSDSEADFVLAHLARNGQVNYIFADDGDMFAFGVTKVVRNLSKHLFKGEPLHLYDLDTMVNKLKKGKFQSHKQFVETCILAKCDYTPTGVKGIGIIKAYQKIVKYGRIEAYLDAEEPECEDGYRRDVKRARKLFRNPRSTDYELVIAERTHELFSSLDPECTKLRHLILDYRGESLDIPKLE